MDPSSQVFATGGASGIVMMVAWIIYRFFFSKHRIVSKCCGREMSLETDAPTPSIKNNTVVENASSPPDSSDQGPTDSSRPVGKRRAGSVGGQNEVSVSSDRQVQDQAQPSSRPSGESASKDSESKPVPESSK
jgi:hypothetical protein